MSRSLRSSDPTRVTALVAGALYLLTFLSSIPAAFLLGPVLTDPGYIAGPGLDGQIRFAALLDLVNGFAAIGTAVALFSIVKRQHEGFALGFVATRLFEAGTLAIGILCMLAVVSLRQAGTTAADAGSLVAVGQGLVAVRDWAFVVGTGMAGFNALLLGTLLYRSRLVPRAIPALGLIGAPIFLTFVVAKILGADLGAATQGLAVAPIFVWELSVGLWMTFKGFRASAPIVVAAKAAQAAEAHEMDSGIARGARPSTTAQAGVA
jgi:hypothetical protein